MHREAERDQAAVELNPFAVGPEEDARPAVREQEFARRPVEVGHEILLAAMPVMSIYPILAQRHGMEGDAAATLLLSTLASFISLNLLIATLHAGWL